MIHFKKILIPFLLILMLCGGYIVSNSNHKKNPAEASIIISNSGSTNSAPWALTIQPDGSANLQYSPRDWQRENNYSPKNYPSQTFLKIVTLVKKIDNVSKIHAANNCMKSVSFGSSTVISYKGNMSKDLNCMQDNIPDVEKQLVAEIQKLPY